ncbi:4Fe-4S dicluster domain-containing protein [Pelotomaculum terephthalicicum JT]|uniref:4Fe-4S dicluster domain-containing protein n=1 Tax=Pelotomaculum TaxID=191373 RepID=UPI0009C9286D|nr:MULTISPECIES: 4Fe-4S dicluster domain-containing protein [Pelotomaculum]MCG9969335.1 4Fe-4S dicluster domain-containing protein [Pelotomaculum terephthalicicum JT]OPX86401.1 MAG: Formate dehydrogenase, nitrate-inducible, iron-sulfur subunit [Pelotomaculum sp. PtaB.Bin117]OPY62138.1 MAG: Formate dehydrogenase, nitrate-inducible, iron-sulfur subunit [Pelotomaculum sp. PtaU1.Bin065]
MSKGVLVDVSRCIGCRSCMVACKTWNDLPAGKSEFTNNWDAPGKVDADNWTVVNYHIVEQDEQIKWRFVKRQCMHCDEPACEAACFTHSFVKTQEGAVIYKPTELNQDYCVGCRYCMIACPFGVPSFQWDKALPFVQKCRFCYDRMKEGMKPACVTACPTGTLKYGERDALLKEAWQRINSNPNYIKRVYGEKEYGGTSWLYISDVPFDEIGLKTKAYGQDVSERSIPSLTWDVLKWTPYIFVGWGAILTALNFYTKRRAEAHHDGEIYEAVNTIEEKKDE